MTMHGDTADTEIADQSTDAQESELPILRADRQQQVVLVEGEEVTAVQVAGEGNEAGGIYLPLRPMCAALGIDYSGQTQRIRRHDVMAAGLRRVRIETADGAQVFLCLELESVLMWLATIDGRLIQSHQHYRQRWPRPREQIPAQRGSGE